MELIEIIIEIIFGCIPALAFIIILWDHIIDDRRLTNRVQRYYEDLENFIFSYLERDYYYIHKVLNELNLDEKSKSEKASNLYHQKYIYFRNILLSEMVDYYKYLGLNFRGKNSN